MVKRSPSVVVSICSNIILMFFIHFCVFVQHSLSDSLEMYLCVCVGLVPMEQESGEEAETCSEGDKLQDLPPCWGLDIVCGKGTDFNYGPWADRQR